MVVAQVLDADYTLDEGLEVRIFGVTADGEPVIATDGSFRPYLYALPVNGADDLAAALDGAALEHDDETVEVRDVAVERKVDGREEVAAVKVVLDEPPEVPKARSALEDRDDVAGTREFDIPFYKRYLIDTDVAPGDWYRFEGEEVDGERRIALSGPPEPADPHDREPSMLAFDLEVIDDEVVMCSFVAEDLDRVLASHDIDHPDVEPVEDEAALLERIVETVQDRDPDILLGYNTDEFDFDVLRDRAEHHGIELTMGRTGERMKFQRRGRFSGANLEGRAHLDLYAFVENVVSMGMRSDTLDLDTVAEELVGANKDDVSWDEMQRFWRKKEELGRFAAYALRDAELAHELGEALVPQILSLSRLTGLPPFDVCRHTYGQLVENFLLRAAHREGALAPNRPTQEERSARYREGRYAGGFVYEPEKGLHENIALFDFRSLYPTIIVAHNISPDTLDVEDCDDETEVEIPEEDRAYSFCRDSPGFIPDLLEDLVRERYEIKAGLADLEEGGQAFRDLDTRQQALKILSNAFYGYMGYNGARWYSRGCAEATTALGRRYIRDTIDRAEDMGLEVVYGDTDSVFLKGGDIRDRVEEFQDEVNAELPEFMELEFEGFYPRGLFTTTDAGEGAKKKYALLAEDGSLKITGFEQVRRDWSRVAKQVQEDVIRRVLEGDVDGAVDRVEEAVERLRGGDVPLDDLKIYTRMTKRPENYEGKTPHSEAAKRAIRRGADVGAGDTIAYVVTRGSGAISDRTELVEYADDYDADYYVENQVVPVALRVLKVFGYTEDQLLGKGKQTGLDRF